MNPSFFRARRFRNKQVNSISGTHNGSVTLQELRDGLEDFTIIIISDSKSINGSSVTQNKTLDLS